LTRAGTFFHLNDNLTRNIVLGGSSQREDEG